jgi:long-subunit fatty acid transport protein
MRRDPPATLNFPAKDETMKTSNSKWSLPLLLAAAIGSAQSEAAAELVPQGAKTGVGARAISMGEAFTAVADDYSALYYNAAGMTQLSRSEVGATFAYGFLENQASFRGGAPDKSSLESAKLNALNMVLTDGGRWSLGLGYYTPVTFDDPLAYRTGEGEYAYFATGQMDHYRLGLAYMVSEEVSLGLAASAISGQEELEIRDGSTVRYLEEYTGFNLEPSFLIHLSDFFSLGGSAVVMERLELVDTYQEEGAGPIESRYDIRHPFQAKMGIAFQSGLTQISVDWHGDFWSSYEYRNFGEAFAARDEYRPNKHALRIGLEQHLDKRGPVLRAGYTWENQEDRRPQPDQRDPYRFSAGIGFAPSREVGLDFAYQYGGSRTRQGSAPGADADLGIDSEAHYVLAALKYRW